MVEKYKIILISCIVFCYYLAYEILNVSFILNVFSKLYVILYIHILLTIIMVFQYFAIFIFSFIVLSSKNRIL